ncbi:hypothetical protein AOLI_G00066050 [Acnodon oligacanthus]
MGNARGPRHLGSASAFHRPSRAETDLIRVGRGCVCPLSTYVSFWGSTGASVDVQKASEGLQEAPGAVMCTKGIRETDIKNHILTTYGASARLGVVAPLLLLSRRDRSFIDSRPHAEGLDPSFLPAKTRQLGVWIVHNEARNQAAAHEPRPPRS